MTSKISVNDFRSKAIHFGIGVSFNGQKRIKDYVDIEKFFLEATYSLDSARLAEGFLCWLLR